MKILTIQLGANKIPNLALLKLAAWHKARGDEVSADEPEPDKVYISTPFAMYNNCIDYSKMYPGAEIEYGGYGFNNCKLPDEIEHIMPDYSYAKELAKTIWNKKTAHDYYSGDYSMGFTTRGCIRKCITPPCRVWQVEGKFTIHANPSEFHDPAHKKIMFMDNNILASKEWFMQTVSYIAEKDLTVMDQNGFDIRLVDGDIAEILGTIKFHKNFIHFALDNSDLMQEFHKKINLILKYKKGRYIIVYCYAKNDIEDVEKRVTLIKQLGCLPFVMPDPEADPIIKRYARYVNRPRISFACTWAEYQIDYWKHSYDKLRRKTLEVKNMQNNVGMVNDNGYR